MPNLSSVAIQAIMTDRTHRGLDTGNIEINDGRIIARETSNHFSESHYDFAGKNIGGRDNGEPGEDD